MCDDDEAGFSVHGPSMPMEVATGFVKPNVIVANFNREQATFIIQGTPTACLNKARQIGAAVFSKPWHFTAIQFDPIHLTDAEITQIDKMPYHGWVMTAHAEIDV